MGIEEALALVALLVKLVPDAEAAYASLVSAFKGTATQADVDNLLAITATLNAQADAAEKAAGASG